MAKPNKTQRNPIKPKKPSGLSGKKDSGHKTMCLKKELRRKRSTIQKKLESSGGGCLKLGRPNLFETPEELLELFNLYLASVQEKVTLEREKAIERYDRTLDKKYKDQYHVHIGGIKIDTQIEEVWKFIQTPSKLKFYVFLGGMHSDTWNEYKKSDKFSETIELIETYLESVIEDGAISGKIPTNIAQFVLNTTYGRVPKNINLDKEYIPTDDETEKLDALVGKNV